MINYNYDNLLFHFLHSINKCLKCWFFFAYVVGNVHFQQKSYDDVDDNGHDNHHHDHNEGYRYRYHSFIIMMNDNIIKYYFLFYKKKDSILFLPYLSFVLLIDISCLSFNFQKHIFLCEKINK